MAIEVQEQVRSGPITEVARRHEVRDQSHIPTAIVDAFAAKGIRITVASGWPSHRSQLSGQSRYPLTEDDLKSISRAKGPKDDGFDAVKAMKVDGAFWINSQGFFEKSDCIAYVQSYDAYNEQLRAATEEWMRQDDPATDEAHYQDLFTPHGRVGPQITPLSVGNPIGRLGDMIGSYEQT